MNSEKLQLITNVINKSLDRAEKHWVQGGHKIVAGNEELARADALSNIYACDQAIPSRIPGHEWVSEGETIISEFVAFVADMRNSTKHLMSAISEKKAKVSQLERVFYETSALLPALAQTIEFEGGRVTEYLGDGILAFFKVDESNMADALYKSRRAAQNSIGDTRRILNEILYDRYLLPPLDLGVGLAMSKAIVSLVGIAEYKQPKAFGECVFRATKMSSGVNEVFVDERMRCIWPTSKGGRVRFKRKSFENGNKAFVGFVMSSTD